MDPELQPIGWAMEEEMEDPGEEVPSCFFWGIRFDNCFSFPFWQVYSMIFFDFWKTLEQKFGMGKEF